MWNVFIDTYDCTGGNTNIMASSPTFTTVEVPESGYLDITVGPMFSGKTSYVTFVLTKFADIGTEKTRYRVCYINYEGDDRETEGGDGLKFSSHSSTLRHMSEKIDCFKAKRLSDIDVTSYHVVGVDESHFYPDLKDTVLYWVNVLHKHVIVCGLDGDFRQNPIGQTLELISESDDHRKLRSQCDLCMESVGTKVRPRTVDFSASFTIRITDETDPLVVGGVDKYKSVCRYHLNKHKRDKGLPV